MRMETANGKLAFKDSGKTKIAPAYAHIHTYVYTYAAMG